jgi:hypothetical protein
MYFTSLVCLVLAGVKRLAAHSPAVAKVKSDFRSISGRYQNSRESLTSTIKSARGKSSYLYNLIGGPEL